MASHFDNPDFARRYLEKGSPFVPAYAEMTRLAGQLIEEKIGGTGRVLIIGAGGGRELAAFATRAPDWSFVAVDPSAEMLNIARGRAGDDGFEGRTDYVAGLVFDAPPGPFDAATCLLTLHFVPDDGARRDTLRAIKERLRPGAPFLLVTLCIDLKEPRAETHLRRYGDYARQSGAANREVDETCDRLRSVLHMVSARREEALLAEAGFCDIDLFYAALSWRGWRATA